MAREEPLDLLITNASEVLTLAKGPVPRTGAAMQELGIVARGAVAIRNGKVVKVGKSSALSKLKAKRTIDADGRVVMPGFVDAHTHVVFAGSRENEVGMKLDGMSYPEIAAQGGGIPATVEATRKASKRELKAQTSERLAHMLQNGTTTAEAKSGYALEPEGELRMLETIAELGAEQPIELVATFLGPHFVPPEYAGRSDEFLTQMIDMLPEVKKRGLAEFVDIFVDQGVFTVQQGRRFLKAAAKEGLKLKVHADELARTGGAELACEVGATSAEHLLKPSEKGVRGLAREGITAVLLPATPFTSFMKGYADANGLITKGVPVALGSDLCPNAWCESMQTAIQLAVYQMRMFVSEAITASTINAAHAIGRAGKVGSLEPGKQADVLILDAPGYEWLGYRLGSNLVRTVVKKGEVVAGVV